MPIVKQPLPAFSGTIAQPDPIWVTPAGIVSAVDPDTEISVQLEATDPFNGSIIYTLKSGILPGFQESFGLMKFLLHADEPDSSVMTVNSVTSFGVPLQGTMTITNTESKFGIGSIDNQNKEGYINFGTPAALGIVNIDFSIHGWFNRKANPPGIYELFSNQERPSNRVAIKVFLDTASVPVFQLVSSSSINYFINGLQSVPLNTWVHIALVKQSNIMYAFVDGILQGTQTMDSSSLRLTADGDLFLCASGELGQPVGSLNFNRFNGRVDEFVIERQARWIANFTPPTEPFSSGAIVAIGDPFFDKVVNLTHFNNDLVDESTKNNTLIHSGTLGTFSTDSKFGSHSFKYSSANPLTRLETPPSSDFDISLGDYTIEFWAKRNDSFGANKFLYRLDTASENQLFLATSSGSSTSTIIWDVNGIRKSISMNMGDWINYAYTIEGTIHRLFLNGLLTFTTDTIAESSTTIDFGFFDTIWGFVNGLIDELRITKGLARYTTNFIVSTEEFLGAVSGLGDPFFDNVSLLMVASDGDVGDTLINDLGPKGKIISNATSVSITDTDSIFDGKSFQFNGTNQFLSIAQDSDFVFAAGEDYTIEFWFKATGGRACMAIGDYNGASGVISCYDVDFGSNAFQQFVPFSTAGRLWQLSAGLRNNEWIHYAAVNDQNTRKLFYNGILQSSIHNTGGGPPLNSNNFVYVGSSSAAVETTNGQPNPDFFIQGFMDQIRITKGIARYTENFTPPSSFTDLTSLPTVPGVKLDNNGLLSGNVGPFLGTTGSDVHDFTVIATSNFTNISTDRNFNIAVFDITLNTDWESLWAGSSVQHTIAEPTSAQFEAATPNNIWLSWPNP